MKRIFAVVLLSILTLPIVARAEDLKEPNVAGAFYPRNPDILTRRIDSLIGSAQGSSIGGHIGMIIVPHAGYDYSGSIAARAYRAIKGRAYSTAVVIAPAHYFSFSGVSVYPAGSFRTPLGLLQVDSEMAGRLLDPEAGIVSEKRAFEKEHSLEVQLPFLQRSLGTVRIVPVIVGDAQLPVLRSLATRLHEVIGTRQDVLVVISTDLYHGYDFAQAPAYDLARIRQMQEKDADGLYRSLREEGSPRMCGGFAVTAGLIYAELTGLDMIELGHTTSAEVTGRKRTGEWCVGYAALAAVKPKQEVAMFNDTQRERLLALARSSIEHHLKAGRRLEVSEEDPLLKERMGAFVTLHDAAGDLRGCIGHMVGDKPLYLTIRDMAVEAALRDPRFPPVSAAELAGLKIEISVLTPLRRVASADEIEMGTHGVVVQRGLRSGVYLPQVARDTGWTREQFLNSLCSQKAGLPADAWRDPMTELYVFSAEVFSEDTH